MGLPTLDTSMNNNGSKTSKVALKARFARISKTNMEVYNVLGSNVCNEGSIDDNVKYAALKTVMKFS